MTLIVKNADSKILSVLESLKMFNPKLNIQEECPICGAYDYTLSPKATKRLKKAIKEVKKGDVVSYKDFESFKADLMRWNTPFKRTKDFKKSFKKLSAKDKENVLE